MFPFNSIHINMDCYNDCFEIIDEIKSEIHPNTSKELINEYTCDYFIFFIISKRTIK